MRRLRPVYYNRAFAVFAAFPRVFWFQPHIVVSVHAAEIDFDGPADELPGSFGRLMYHRIGVYPGSLGNFSGLHRQIPVITVELENAQKMPTDEEVKRIWRDMVILISRNITDTNGDGKAQ